MSAQPAAPGVIYDVCTHDPRAERRRNLQAMIAALRTAGREWVPATAMAKHLGIPVNQITATAERHPRSVRMRIVHHRGSTHGIAHEIALHPDLGGTDSVSAAIAQQEALNRQRAAQLARHFDTTRIH